MSDLGEPCPRCGDRIGVLNTAIEGERRVRYLGCHACRYRPDDNKQILPLELAPPRRLRMRRLRLSRKGRAG